MRLRDYLSTQGSSPKALVAGVADWLEEQARTPDVVPTCDAQRRVEANALRIAAGEIRDQLASWQ